MARLVDIDWQPNRSKLRSFGLLATAVFGVAAWLASRQLWIFADAGELRPLLAVSLGSVAVFSLLASWAFPAANRPLYVLLTALALPVGIVMSYVLLALLFYGVILPVRGVLQLAGIDPMNRRPARHQETYWVKCRPSRVDSSYFRQY